MSWLSLLLLDSGVRHWALLTLQRGSRRPCDLLLLGALLLRWTGGSHSCVAEAIVSIT